MKKLEGPALVAMRMSRLLCTRRSSGAASHRFGRTWEGEVVAPKENEKVISWPSIHTERWDLKVRQLLTRRTK